MLDQVEKKKEREMCQAIYASDMLTVGRHVYIQQSALTHCASGQPLWPVWCVRSSRAFLSLRSTLIPGEHVRWNSLPIKTGISQVGCGNRPSVGKQRVSPSLLPSSTLSLILTRSCSWNSLPPLSFSPFTVTLPPYSHPIFCLFPTFSF